MTSLQKKRRSSRRCLSENHTMAIMWRCVESPAAQAPILSIVGGILVIFKRPDCLIEAVRMT
jgi:hypothetical protein